MSTKTSIPNPLSRALGAVKQADELADIIANPDPSRPFRNAVGGTGRRICDFYGATPDLARVAFGPANLYIPLICKPYWDKNDYDPPVVEGPGFTGGQCDVLYTVTVTNNSSDQVGFTQFLGPFGSAVLTGIGNPIYQVFRADGSFVGNFGVTFGAVINPSIRFIRVDGQPDDCGDAEDSIEPGPNPPPDPGPFPPGEEPGFDPITGQPFFFVPDIPNPIDGEPPIPVDDPFADPAPPPAPPAGGDGLPGDGDAIAPEAGEVTGGEDGEDIDFGEPPEGRVWIGCIIETSSVGALGNIAGTGPESTVWPTVRANAALNYGSRKGTSNRINSKFHDLIRPATSLIVTGVFLQVQPGSTSKVFPLSALTCPENPCED